MRSPEGTEVSSGNALWLAEAPALRGDHREPRGAQGGRAGVAWPKLAAGEHRVGEPQNIESLKLGTNLERRGRQQRVSGAGRFERDRPDQAVSGTSQHPRVMRRGHGKEGVDGSSPSEGLHKVPANRHFIVVGSLNRGHIPDTLAVRATQRDASRRLPTQPSRVVRAPSSPIYLQRSDLCCLEGRKERTLLRREGFIGEQLHHPQEAACRVEAAGL